MKAVVLPNCPYCGAKYVRAYDDRLEEASPTKAVLIRCGRCRERYYACKQVRYIARESA